MKSLTESKLLSLDTVMRGRKAGRIVKTELEKLHDRRVRFYGGIFQILVSFYRIIPIN